MRCAIVGLCASSIFSEECSRTCTRTMNVPKGKLENFDGHLGHLVDGATPSNFFIYVIPQMSDVAKQSIRAALISNSGEIQPIPLADNLENGCVYVVREEENYERAWFIKDDKEGKGVVEMVLIDKGRGMMVPRDEVLKCPHEAAVFDVFGVMCPFLISNASGELRHVAETLNGQECRCICDRAVNESETIPYVKGHVLVQYENGTYADLKDIAVTPVEGKDYAKFMFEHAPNAPTNTLPADTGNPSFSVPANEGDVQCSTPPSSGGMRNESEHTEQNDQREFRLFTPRSRGRGLFLGRGFTPRGGLSAWSGGMFEDRGTNEHDEVPPSMFGSGFKELEPMSYPKLFRVRYDREDREMPLTQFWVVDPAMFSTMERLLYEGRRRYSELQTAVRVPLAQLNGMGCLVRTYIDGATSACLCRAIVGEYSYRLRKLSVYLIDFGQFKWVRGCDLFDISMLDETDPVRAMHAAMFRCRLDQNAKMRIQDFTKGMEYELWLLSKGPDGVFVVNTVNPNGTPLGNALSPRYLLETLLSVERVQPQQQHQPVGTVVVNQALQNPLPPPSQQQPQPQEHPTFSDALPSSVSTIPIPAATAAGLPSFAPLWPQFPTFGVPYVMPVPFPVAIVAPPPAPAAPEGQQNPKTVGQQIADGGSSGNATQQHNERARGGSFEFDSVVRNNSDRFRGGRWGGGGDGTRGRSFGGFDEAIRRESFSFTGFGRRSDGWTRGGGSFNGEGRGVFTRGRQRGGNDFASRRGARPFRRGGAVDNQFYSGRGKDGWASGGGFFGSFEREERTEQVKKVSSAWDLPPSWNKSITPTPAPSPTAPPANEAIGENGEKETKDVAEKDERPDKL
ncbi:hypothetical protein Tcan_13482 [Toxocara canis]|uniref:Tudor domain-containing protein n=1 Tax=Toxocara canis TaxID=6265 RepID=A0A0B2VPN3_TOXCA|nr:hypothetical protein Tcan_13482 [Toxocara canis]